MNKPIVLILFRAPDICIEWSAMNRPVVALYAHELQVRAVKKEFKFSFDLTMQSIIIEDALQPAGSPLQHLASSATGEDQGHTTIVVKYQYVSQVR